MARDLREARDPDRHRPLAGAFASTPLDGGMLDLARAVSPCARVGIITEIFIDNTEANLEVPRAG